jgi:hypothetical protein
MNVKIRRVSTGDAHTDQKWLTLEGYVDGVPEVTKRRAISTAALASGDVEFEKEKAKLIADVAEYATRWEAVQEALNSL